MSGTMVEVNRTVLLGQLRNARATELGRHRNELAAYPKALEKWHTKVANELVRLAGRMNGKPIDGFERGWRGQLTVPIKVPEQPAKPTLNLCQYDRAIKIVSLTKAETFRLHTDDYIVRLITPDSC